MRSTIISLNLFLFLFVYSQPAKGQKLNKKNMEARITVLEEENKKIKKEMQVMKSQIRMLLSNLPKPSKDTRARGGLRGNESGSSGQIAANATTMTFEKTNHDFGQIKKDASVSYTFKFTNTGTNPLTVINAKGSCGCTVPKWPKEPIPPGEQGEIQVTFNSKGKNGNQHKSITLTANTDPANTRIYIKAKIQE